MGKLLFYEKGFRFEKNKDVPLAAFTKFPNILFRLNSKAVKQFNINPNHFVIFGWDAKNKIFGAKFVPSRKPGCKKIAGRKCGVVRISARGVLAHFRIKPILNHLYPVNFNKKKNLLTVQL